jgi:hypothetical protein
MAEPTLTVDVPQGQSASEAVPEESVLGASTGDLPTDEDNLGFEPYVQAGAR